MDLRLAVYFHEVNCTDEPHGHLGQNCAQRMFLPSLIHSIDCLVRAFISGLANPFPVSLCLSISVLRADMLL